MENAALTERAIAEHPRLPRPHLTAAPARVEAALELLDPEATPFGYEKATGLRDELSARLAGENLPEHGRMLVLDGVHVERPDGTLGRVQRLRRINGRDTGRRAACGGTLRIIARQRPLCFCTPPAARVPDRRPPRQRRSSPRHTRDRACFRTPPDRPAHRPGLDT